MTSLQIEYFFALARYKSFSLAADAMYVSQAAVSKQIAALESKMWKEKQLNRRMEIHAELKLLRKQIDS